MVPVELGERVLESWDAPGLYEIGCAHGQTRGREEGAAALERMDAQLPVQLAREGPGSLPHGHLAAVRGQPGPQVACPAALCLHGGPGAGCSFLPRCDGRVPQDAEAELDLVAQARQVGCQHVIAL